MIQPLFHFVRRTIFRTLPQAQHQPHRMRTQMVVLVVPDEAGESKLRDCV